MMAEQESLSGGCQIGVELRGSRVQSCAGFTMLELLIGTTVLGIVAVGLLERLTYYQEYAEKIVLESTVRNIRSGLQLRRAELMLQEDREQQKALLTTNPVRWLETEPVGYMGEGKRLEWQAIPPGSWYFDADARELIYRPKLTRHFASLSQAPAVVRYGVGSSESGNRKTDDLKTDGLTFQLRTPYRWFE